MKVFDVNNMPVTDEEWKEGLPDHDSLLKQICDNYFDCLRKMGNSAPLAFIEVMERVLGVNKKEDKTAVNEPVASRENTNTVKWSTRGY